MKTQPAPVPKHCGMSPRTEIYGWGTAEMGCRGCGISVTGRNAPEALAMWRGAMRELSAMAKRSKKGAKHGKA